MHAYVVKRLALMLPTLLGVSLLTFTLIRIVPGDAAMLLLGDAPATDRRAERAVRQQLGLDQPFWAAYGGWLLNLARFDFGTSLVNGRPVRDALAARIPVSLELALLALAITLGIGIPVGVLAAKRPDGPIDVASRAFTTVALSMPDFWIGTLFIVIPSLLWRYAPPVTYVPIWENPVAHLQIIAVPAIALGVRYSASVMRFTRSGMLGVLRQDYIRTARAKGLRGRQVVMEHGLKNALIPVLTLLGGQLSRLLGGAVVIETLFALPGVGRSTIDAVGMRDYPQLQANVLFIALVYLVTNFVVDVLYARIDPRIRLQ